MSFSKLCPAMKYFFDITVPDIHLYKDSKCILCGYIYQRKVPSVYSIFSSSKIYTPSRNILAAVEQLIINKSYLNMLPGFLTESFVVPALLITAVSLIHRLYFSNKSM